MARVVIREGFYYCYQDEKHFYEWLESIRAVRKVVGGPGELTIHFAKPLSRDDWGDLCLASSQDTARHAPVADAGRQTTRSLVTRSCKVLAQLDVDRWSSRDPGASKEDRGPEEAGLTRPFGDACFGCG